jgi:predicted nucleic acid-binding protein
LRFWDASAIVALVLGEAGTPNVETVLSVDPDMSIWWGTPVECRSALMRHARAGHLMEQNLTVAHQTLAMILGRAREVIPTAALRDRAVRLLEGHDLRASDALQLAAGLMWTRDRPAGAGFVCLDRRLRLAAVREGFTVWPTDSSDV